MDCKGRILQLFLFLVFACKVSTIQGHDFYVGGTDGWISNPSERFNHWAERNRFRMHDNLVFKYKKHEDSVVEVNHANYIACNTSNPIRRMGSGDSWFTLERSGPFFFISGNQTHCVAGQKMIVVVLSPRPSNPPPDSKAPSLSPSATPSPSFPNPPPSGYSPPDIAPAPSPSGASHSTSSPVVIGFTVGLVVCRLFST